MTTTQIFIAGAVAGFSAGLLVLVCALAIRGMGDAFSARGDGRE